MSNNSKQWSSANPGYIIFLIDQSGSMGEDYTGGKNKAEFTSLVINRTINDLIFTNSAGDKIKDRVFISLIGYGGNGGNSIDDLKSEYISYYAENPIRFEKVKKKQADGAGGLVEFEEEMAVHLEANSNGLTPMGEAFKFAKQLIEGWITKKPDNPAPIVINVSDGYPYEGDGGNEPNKTIQYADEIKRLSTTDGNPIIFNVHIQKKGNQKGFDTSDVNLTEANEKLLFNISSNIPTAYLVSAEKYGLTEEFEIKEGSKGYVANAKPETLVKFINFGSSGPGTDKII